MEGDELPPHPAVGAPINGAVVARVKEARGPTSWQGPDALRSVCALGS